MCMSKEPGRELISELKTTEPVKILLADDDQDDRELFGDALQEAGINSELVTVENGQEVIENLKDKETPNPDIVFLDINMPVKNGKETLQEMKSDEELKDIP